MITGTSGKGKTQFIKHLVCRLMEQGKNVLIIDFRNDFAPDEEFLRQTSIDCVNVSLKGLPFNPLIPFPFIHPETKKEVVQFEPHIAGLASVIEKTYNLGHIQEVQLKTAIRQALKEREIEIQETPEFDPEWDFPDMNMVGDILSQSENSSAKQAYARLDEIFNLGLFKPEFRQITFDTFLRKSTIINLNRLDEETGVTIAGLIVLSAHNYLNSKPHQRGIKQSLVIDEANRILSKKYTFLNQFIRECRAYGVSTVLSSQNLEEFNNEISGSCATKIVHGADSKKNEIKRIGELISLDKTRYSEIENLGLFEAFVDNSQHKKTFIHTMHYPLYLICSYLEQNTDVKLEQIKNIPGIDQGNLDDNYFVKQLEDRVLAENNDGIIQLIDRDE